MKFFKSSFALLSAALLLTATLAGCSDNKNNSDVSSTLESSSSIAVDDTDTFDFSLYLDDNGHWKNIKASDYVETLNCKDIVIPKSVSNISDETVQSQIDMLVSSYSTVNQITDRAVVDGDTVNIDYVGTVDGTEFDGGSASGQDVTIGVTNFIDDFLEQIIGHKGGDVFDINVTFPEDYHAAELAGKDAVFNTTVNYISETVAPELTDEFVAENFTASYGWKDVADMKAKIAAQLKTNAVEGFIREYLITEVTVEKVPEEILEYQNQTVLDYYKSMAANSGMTLDEYLSSTLGMKNTDELLEQHKDDNAKGAQLSLMLESVAEDADLNASDEDVAAYFEEHYGSPDYSSYEEAYGMEYLKFNVLRDKVFKYITENASYE